VLVYLNSCRRPRECASRDREGCCAFVPGVSVVSSNGSGAAAATCGSGVWEGRGEQQGNKGFVRVSCFRLWFYTAIFGLALMGCYLLGRTTRSRGSRETGTGNDGSSPPPPSPTGINFSLFSSPRGQNCYHPRLLIGEFPAGNRGSGPRCHP
jgi:hypothetical protein